MSVSDGGWAGPASGAARELGRLDGACVGGYALVDWAAVVAETERECQLAADVIAVHAEHAPRWVRRGSRRMARWLAELDDLVVELGYWEKELGKARVLEAAQ